jgi:2-amino-4-hydroxy-6-hydroxymethyldihydropteridine diphosphokinase
MPEVYVSLGSNVARERNVPSALEELRRAFGRLTVSDVYESEAVGFAGDPFYNLVVMFESELPVQAIAERLSEIEARHGRTRASAKFSPRTLDLDLLLYGDDVVQEGRIKLPRKEITEYAFMLEPLAEIAPDHMHPELKQTYAALWAAFDKSRAKQRRIAAPWSAS